MLENSHKDEDNKANIKSFVLDLDDEPLVEMRTSQTQTEVIRKKSMVKGMVLI